MELIVDHIQEKAEALKLQGMVRKCGSVFLVWMWERISLYGGKNTWTGFI